MGYLEAVRIPPLDESIRTGNGQRIPWDHFSGGNHLPTAQSELLKRLSYLLLLESTEVYYLLL
jgi:hypothetical protein